MKFAQSLRTGFADLANVAPDGIARRLSTDSRGARVLRPLVNRLLPDALTIVTVRHGRNQGLRIPIYPRLEKYYWTGTYEEELQEALWKFLVPGGVFWDVGAHIGFFSSLASRKVGLSGRVIAVEPSPANLSRLHTVLRLNELGNISVLPLAVLETAGKAQFVPAQASSMGFVAEGEAHGGIRVTAQSLDALLQQLPVPDVVKVDVEGAELAVLRGSKTLLKHHRPTLLVEVPPAELRTALGNIVDGYSVVALAPRHSLAVPEMRAA